LIDKETDGFPFSGEQMVHHMVSDVFEDNSGNLQFLSRGSPLLVSEQCSAFWNGRNISDLTQEGKTVKGKEDRDRNRHRDRQRQTETKREGRDRRPRRMDREAERIETNRQRLRQRQRQRDERWRPR
jgi:hypothetical protein